MADCQQISNVKKNLKVKNSVLIKLMFEKIKCVPKIMSFDQVWLICVRLFLMCVINVRY